jgi:hypothetical protein
MPVEATGRNALSQVWNNPLSQRCAKIIAFGTSWNKGKDFQGISLLSCVIRQDILSRCK